MRPNLIIADDHKMFLEGLLFILNKEEQYNIIFTCKNGADVIKYLEANTRDQVDLVITDISMPEVDGIALNRFIKRSFPDIKVLIVSMHHDVTMISTLIEEQVDGYVPKDAERRELLTAIHSILSGEKFFSQKIQMAFSHSVFSGDKALIDSISDKEKEILRLIAMEHTTQEISSILCLSKHTIDSYRKNLLSKLGVRNIAGLTKYAIKLGLVDG